MTDFIQTSEAAEILGRSQRTVIRYIKDGTLKPVQTLANGVYLLDKADVLHVAAVIQKAEASA